MLEVKIIENAKNTLEIIFGSPIVLVLIGALISIITNLITAKLQFKHEKEHTLEAEKRQAYIDFLILHQKIATHNLACVKKNEAVENIKSNEILELNEIVKPKMQLYFDKEINGISMEILSLITPESEQQAEDWAKRRSELFNRIIPLMKKDLGIEEK